MIRITIELVPGGIGTPRRMHVIEIWNDVKKSVETSGAYGDYGYRISRKVNKDKNPSWVKTGQVTGFNRKNRNAVQLLLDVLNDAYTNDKRKSNT